MVGRLGYQPLESTFAETTSSGLSRMDLTFHFSSEILKPVARDECVEAVLSYDFFHHVKSSSRNDGDCVMRGTRMVFIEPGKVHECSISHRPETARAPGAGFDRNFVDYIKTHP
jgi:hypothetical protein